MTVIMLGICQVKAQTPTYGSGKLTNDASCTDAGDDGNCSDTYIGSAAGSVNTGYYNSFFGAEAGYSNQGAKDNIAIGYQALRTQSFNNGQIPYSTFNIAIGNQSLFNNQPTTSLGICNIAIGYRALFSNSTGYDNTASGYQSLYSNTVGYYNSAYGYESLKHNITGIENTAIGYRALYTNTGITTGNDNTALGYYTLKLSIGNNNTAIGSSVMLYNNAGADNTAIGFASLYSNLTGNNNTALGERALNFNTTGSNATAIGYYAMYNANSNTNLVTNYNVAVGYSALQGSSIPGNNTGNNNTALGYQTLYVNSSGNYNTATGYNSLFSNSTGSANTAVGFQALYNNTAGGNTAMGYQALYNNTTGSGTPGDGSNTAVGNLALWSNIDGHENSAFGHGALFSNNNGNTGNGNRNCAFGQFTLYNSVTGNDNTALGFDALGTNTTGSNNTSVGIYAGDNNTTESNNTCIGYGANIPAGLNNCTSLGFQAGNNNWMSIDNQMQLGNASLTDIFCWNAIIWSGSDKRIKKNIQQNVPGLSFINLLNPVTYNIDIHTENSIIGYPTKTTIIPAVTDTSGNIITPASVITSNDTVFWPGKYNIEHKLFSGLLAQQVYSAANQIGYNFSGISVPTDSNHFFALDYSQFTVPLIKAVQELSKSNDSLKQLLKKIDSLMIQKKTKDSLLTENLNNLAASVANCCTQGATNKNMNNTVGNDSLINTLKIKLAFSEQALLGNAQPNPNSGSTQIPYFVPREITNAQIIFTDILGKIINTSELVKGYGIITVDTQDLPNGTYSYTMIIDGKIYDSKKMIRSK